MRTPLVSVIIPLYNHEQFIKRAIQSVLSQTLSNFELIVINDGSKDQSEARVLEFQDPRIRYFTQQNRGAHNTLNRGVQLARGRYISVLNSDDVYHPERLKQCVRVCEKEPAVGACFSYIGIINSRGLPRGSINGVSHNSSVLERDLTFRGRRNVLLDLLGGNFLATTSNLFCRRSVLRRTGPFKPFRYAHDYDCFLRLAVITRLHVIPQQLLLYRVHRNNTIKESKAAAHFEHALILARTLCGDALNSIVSKRGNPYEIMTRLFNSVETFGADKILFILVMSILRSKNRVDEIERELICNPENLFRKRAIGYLQNPDGCGSPKERIRGGVRKLNSRLELSSSVYLFGTGKFAQIVYRHLNRRRFRPMGYFDNNSGIIGGTKNSLPIEAPKLIPGIKVIIASSARRPIYQQLRKIGYSCGDIIEIK